MPAYEEKRKASRRAKTLRFRFEAGGEEYRAVCANVSAGGAFLKASFVPGKGEQVLLREIGRGNRDMGLAVAGQVVWTIPKATLENPETGYAVQFLEATSTGDEAPLRDFLDTLAPGKALTLATEQRGGGVVSVYRFQSEADARVPGPGGVASPTYDDLPEADLATRLDRLERQQQRRAQPTPVDVRASESKSMDKRALSYYTRARPSRGSLGQPQHPTGQQPQAAPPSPHAAPRQSAKPPQPQARQVAPRASMPPTRQPSAAGHRPVHPATRQPPATGPFAGPPLRAESQVSPRKREFGGLLGLFGVNGGDAEGPSDPGLEQGFEEGSEPLSPTFDQAPRDAYAASDDWYVSEEHPGDVLLAWKDHETEGRVEKISNTMVAVNTAGAAPQHYERVTITPAFPSFRNPRVVLHGTVTRIKDRHGDGSQTVLVRFAKIDEHGKPGAFQEYLKLFKG